MANTIVIDDGLKTYDIANTKGEILGQFVFNPADVNILDRYNEVIKNLEGMDMKLPQDTAEEDVAEEKRKIDSVICENIDYLLGAEASKNFFAIMGPLSLLANGQLFVENVLDAIGLVIQKETGERVKKLNTKIKKYTSKYHG